MKGVGKMVVQVSGDIVTDNDKWIYDWLEWDCTCPKQIQDAINSLPVGDRLEIKINSGGGDLFAGIEIYSILHERDDVDIEVQSLAGSAASIIAMAGRSSISPAAMLMIHDVSIHGASGNKQDLKKLSKDLAKMDESVAGAYAEKTGMGLDEILKLMDSTTWMTAQDAVEKGFIDAIAKEQVSMSNAAGNMRLTDEIRAKVVAEKEAMEKREAEKAAILSDLDKYGA